MDPDITQALQSAVKGDAKAEAELWELVYPELRRFAHNQLISERKGHTLSTTALVNEVFLRLLDLDRIDVSSRAHFFALSCRAMRHILIEHARKRSAKKRSKDDDEPLLGSGENEMGSEELLALDQALTGLAEHDERLVRLVEARYFGGFSSPEIADMLGVSKRTVERDWLRAKAYLFRALHPKSV